jgi:putative salt-induced outer membrane protein
LLEWRKNRFSGYTEQTFETVGFGHRFLNNDKFKLNAELGVGLTQQTFVAQELPRIEEDEDNTVYTVAGEFIWNISDTASFEQLASARAASDNTAWETITRLKVDIVDTLALAIAYNIQGNTDVAPDIDKTDRYTSIQLDYSF